MKLPSWMDDVSNGLFAFVLDSKDQRLASVPFPDGIDMYGDNFPDWLADWATGAFPEHPTLVLPALEADKMIGHPDELALLIGNKQGEGYRRYLSRA